MFDDRLATVLRTAARSEMAARTQYRQLLDLLGSMAPEAEGELVEAAYRRLGELADELPATTQSRILRAPGLRLRNRALVAWLAEREPQAAAAAMATANLSDRDWLFMIPRLPVTARGFLRHRRDLPLGARQVLERLGVKDLVLPMPDPVEPEPVAAAAGAQEEEPIPALEAAAAPSPVDQPPGSDESSDAEAGIRALVQRIEAFQRARREGSDVRTGGVSERGTLPSRFDFETSADGVISWAEAPMAPFTVGLRLGSALAQLDEHGAAALAGRLPVRGRVMVTGAAAIEGEWRIDAGPRFDPASGAFTGYLGRLRRLSQDRAAPKNDDEVDRMRQVLHELRTPVNAIQGFAEIIQQQLFGPAPHEYRALAGAIAVDAARLMAGFEELDRLAQLESGALAPQHGASDLREVLGEMLRRLDGALRPRSARIALTASGESFLVALDAQEAQRLAWRLLATLAGSMAPGEVIDLHLSSDGARITLQADVPAALIEDGGDMFAAVAPAQARAVSAGMFGSGFALRLARAEAVAAGGALSSGEDTLTLELPALTAGEPAHTATPENRR